MVIKKLFLCSFVLTAVACSHQASNNDGTNVSTSFNEEEFIPPTNNDRVFNSSFSNITNYYWVGMFGDVNKISVKIQEMKEDKTVTGFSVAAGNIRPFKGTYTNTNNKIFSFSVKEPGDDKYDGAFSFTIRNKMLKGNWKPFDASSTTPKTFTLLPRIFKYNPKAGDSYTSVKILKESDVNNLTKEELRYMRSEIYARHGYAFKMKDIRREFDYVSWYMPVSVDVRKDLTDIENKNIALINRYEKYAKEYYDDYGR